MSQPTNLNAFMMGPIPGHKIKGTTVFLIYDLMFLIYGIFYFPYAVLKGKQLAGFWARFGNISAQAIRSFSDRKNIWVHAVSVGEVLAVKDLVAKIQERFPQKHVVVSTVTATGYEVARSNFKGQVTVIFAPFDFSWVVGQFVRLIKPQIYIAVETELWPNLYARFAKEGTAIVQVNGRISDRSFARYRQIKFLTRKILKCVRKFCMQTEEDARRIIELGAHAERVLIPGNLKFDNLPAETLLKATDLGFNFNDEILIAGSTHPGEEQILLECYQKLKSQYPHLRLVVCPRHIERAPEVLALLESKGMQGMLLSELERADKIFDRVVVVDSIGRLKDLYAIATIVFVGKTLRVGGGQNMIEPAFFAKPIIVGPLTYNFKDVMKMFLNEHAMIQLRDESELFVKVEELLSTPQLREAIGNRARQLVLRYQGATEKTIKEIAKLLS